MKQLYRQKTITRGVLILSLFFLILIGGASFLFVKTGHSIAKRLVDEEKRYASSLIELKSHELMKELEKKIGSNLKTISRVIAGFLYNYETAAVRETLTPYFDFEEVRSLDLIELPQGKTLIHMMKAAYDGTEEYGRLEQDILYNGRVLGRLTVTYSMEEILKKAREQNIAMEQNQETIQRRVVETAYAQMLKYAVLFGAALLAVLGGVLGTLLYLDREVSRKSAELETINGKLALRVSEEVRKNRDKEQLMIEQSKMAAMGEMIGAIAHQWRQPLNALGLYIQDMEDAYRHNELDLSYIRSVTEDSMRQINFMSKTIDDFRNFFKPSKVQKEFSVRESVEEVLRLIRPQLKNHHIERVAISGEEEGCLADGYKNEFEQVILNIITNAKDAFLEKSKEGFDIGNAEIMIAIGKKDEKITVEISDNAGGMDEAVLARVFEPYFTTKEKGQGTGIGLYMSKTIIEKNMGGSIRVENIVHNDRPGAKFTIALNAFSCNKESYVHG